MHCEKCGAEFNDELKLCPECGEKSEKEGIEKKSDELQCEEKKPDKKKKIALTAVLAVLLAVAIAGGSVLFAFLNKPITKISRAIDKTLFNSSSIDVSVTVKKFLTDDQLSASLDFGKGIKGSSFEGKYKSRKSENTISVKNGIVYINGAEKTSVDEFIREAQNSGNENKKMAARFLEVLDSSIDGKLDKKTLEAFITDELLPYYSDTNGSSEVPDYEETQKALEKIFEECEKREAIKITQTKKEKAEVFAFDVDSAETIDCIFELSEEDETIAAYINMLVETVKEYSGGFISSKDELKNILQRFITGSDMNFSITIESGRVTGIQISDDVTIKIDSQK